MAVKHDALRDMFSFLQIGNGYKPNIPALKENCEQLITAMTQKTGGQEQYRKASDVDFNHIDAIVNSIVIEALSLYLSGELDRTEAEAIPGHAPGETRIKTAGGVELLPCPFCGSEDVKDRGKAKGRRREAFIQCHRCNARSAVIDGDVSESYYELIREAEKLWNRRMR